MGQALMAIQRGQKLSRGEGDDLAGAILPSCAVTRCGTREADTMEEVAQCRRKLQVQMWYAG